MTVPQRIHSDFKKHKNYGSPIAAFFFILDYSYGFYCRTAVLENAVFIRMSVPDIVRESTVFSWSYAVVLLVQAPINEFNYSYCYV